MTGLPFSAEEKADTRMVRLSCQKLESSIAGMKNVEKKRNLSENSKQLKKYIGNFITFGESLLRIRKEQVWYSRMSVQDFPRACNKLVQRLLPEAYAPYR